MDAVAGVVEQHVDSTKFFDRAVDDGGDALIGGHVSLDGHRGPTEGTDSLSSLFCLGSVSGHRNNVGASLTEGDGQSLTNASGCTGDDDVFAGERQRVENRHGSLSIARVGLWRPRYTCGPAESLRSLDPLIGKGKSEKLAQLSRGVDNVGRVGPLIFRAVSPGHRNAGKAPLGGRLEVVNTIAHHHRVVE